MKNNYRILIIFISISTNIFAQWHPLATGVTNDLYSVYFLDDDTGYVVGDNGTILKTTDGGTHWTLQNSGVTNNLFSVHFLSNNSGFAIGDSGILLNTLDGGETWISKYISQRYLSDITFTNNRIGFIVGNNSILRSADDGNNWTFCTSVAGGYISFPDANTGYEFSCSGLKKTIDGGITWTFINSNNCLPTEPMFNDIFFSDKNTGYIVGGGDHYGLITKTTDGGISWNTMGNGSGIGVLDGIFYSVFFISNDTGYSVGQMLGYKGLTGTVVNTTDGANWEIQSYSLTDRLYSVFFSSKKIGYSVGKNGVILKTTNGGGIFPENNSDQVIAYPNPTHGNVTLLFPENWDIQTVEIVIFDIVGRKVKKISMKIKQNYLFQ